MNPAESNLSEVLTVIRLKLALHPALRARTAQTSSQTNKNAASFFLKEIKALKKSGTLLNKGYRRLVTLLNPERNPNFLQDYDALVARYDTVNEQRNAKAGLSDHDRILAAFEVLRGYGFVCKEGHCSDDDLTEEERILVSAYGIVCYPPLTLSEQQANSGYFPRSIGSLNYMVQSADMFQLVLSVFQDVNLKPVLLYSPVRIKTQGQLDLVSCKVVIE